MLIRTKYFGEIDIEDSKIITFHDGIMGFKEFKKYTILFDKEESESKISWLQSIEEPSLALPVINPYLVDEKYSPIVNDELLSNLGELTDENLVMFLSLTVPSDIKKTTTNMKAPFIINSDNKKAIQLVAENQEYEVRVNVYEIFQNQGKKGESLC